MQERPQDDDRHRQRERGLRQGDAPPGVPEVQLAGDDDEQRDDRDRRREQQPEHEDHVERLAPPELVARQRVGRHQPEDDGHHGGHQRDDRRVERVAPEARAGQHPLVVRRAPTGSGSPAGRLGQLGVGAEAAEHGVQHRAEGDGDDDQGDELDQGRAAAVGPGARDAATAGAVGAAGGVATGRLIGPSSIRHPTPRRRGAGRSTW